MVVIRMFTQLQLVNKLIMRPCTSFLLESTLNLLELGVMVNTYFHLGISLSTRKAYNTGWKNYTAFCTQAKRQAIPDSEDTLLLFVTYPASQHLCSSTIQVYLSAVCYDNIASGKHLKFQNQLSPRLYQVIKGIHKVQSVSQPPRIRMEGIQSVLSK